MSFREAIIEFERFSYRPLSLRPTLLRWQHSPCCPKAVVAIQPAVTECVGWILFDSAMKVVTAFLVLLRRVLPPVLAALQVELVCFRVFRVALAQPRLVFLAEFNRQSPHDSVRDGILQSKDLCHFLVEGSRPQRRSIGDTEQTDRHPDFVGMALKAA